MILDVTCSSKRIWPAFADIRCDISPASKPDAIADARHLPFPDGFADEIYCDPPHIYSSKSGFSRSSLKRITDYYPRFSGWKDRAEWVNFLQLAGREFYRVLKPNGRLYFKLPDDGSKTMVGIGDLVNLGGFTIENRGISKANGPFANMNRKKGRHVTDICYVRLRRYNDKAWALS